MTESGNREQCPTCRALLRDDTMTCPACGEKVRYLRGQRLREPKVAVSRTIAWGQAKPHPVLQAGALVVALVSVVLAAPTHLVWGVVPCAAATVVLLARRPRHSDGEGTFAYRLWVRPTSRAISEDFVPAANQRLVVTEPFSAVAFVVVIVFCGLAPVALLRMASSTDAFTQCLLAQVLAWVALALAATRMQLRDRESESVEVAITAR